MRSPRLLSPTRPVALLATLLTLSGASALSASVPGPRAQPDPTARARALGIGIQSAIALVHDGAGFSADLPTGTFSDGKPDTRPEMALAVRKVPEVIAASLTRLDPAARRAADPVNDAAKLRLATFTGEHSFRRTLAWYEPLLAEFDTELAMLGADVDQIKKTLEVLDERVERLKKLAAPGKPQEAGPGNML